MTDKLYELANNIFEKINARGGCALMLMLLCAWLVYKDHQQYHLSIKKHEVQMEMVGELEAISALLTSCKRQFAYNER